MYLCNGDQNIKYINLTKQTSVYLYIYIQTLYTHMGGFVKGPPFNSHKNEHGRRKFRGIYIYIYVYSLVEWSPPDSTKSNFMAWGSDKQIISLYTYEHIIYIWRYMYIHRYIQRY